MLFLHFLKIFAFEKRENFDFSNVKMYPPLIAPGPPIRDILYKPLDWPVSKPRLKVQGKGNREDRLADPYKRLKNLISFRNWYNHH